MIITLDDRFYDQEVSLLQQKARSYTIPIYKMESDVPCLEGSGLLICIGIRKFIVTAAHVIDLLITQPDSVAFAIPVDKSFMKISGFVYSSIPPDGDRTKDILDIAIISIDDEYEIPLRKAGFDFLTIGQIGLEHQIVMDTHYFLLGYPETKTKTKYGPKIIKSVAIAYLTKVMSDFQIDERNVKGISGKTHIVVNYIRKNVKTMGGENATLPILNGISGGGIWHFVPNPPEFELRLVGIVIEEKQIIQDTSKDIIAIRIDLAISVIKKYFPELTSQIPKLYYPVSIS